MINKKRIILAVAIFIVLSLMSSEEVLAAGEGKMAYIDPITIVNSYDKTRDEEDALNTKYEKKQKDRDRMVEKIRNLKGHGLVEGVSTRLLIYAARLIKEGLPARRACEVAVVWSLTDDIEIQRSIQEVVTAIFE